MTQSFWEELYETLSGLFGDAGAAVLSVEQDIKLEESVPGRDRSRNRLHEDNTHSNFAHNNNFARLGGVAFARVVYSMPYVHWYRVQVDGLGDMPACGISETGTTPFSVHNTSTFPVHSSVLVWVPEDQHCAYILGVVPDKNEDGGLVFPDNLFAGSGVGFKWEEYYKGLFGLTSSDGDVTDFSNNRALDGLGGEWGRLAEMGGGLHVDNLVSFIRADECTGLWCHYMDRLARLSGHNLDIRTAISELTVRSDTGEGIHTFGSTAYPWEAMGALTPGVEVLREETDKDVIFSKHVAKLEPVTDDQQPFYRLEEFRGYLGQAFMRHVSIPGIETGLLSASDQGKKLTGVFREQIGMDGSWGVESAHSVSIAKRSIIPIARRRLAVEDATGDRAANYNFSGRDVDPDETEPAHKIKSISGSGVQGHVQETLGLSDLTAYLFEWKGLHPFHYHTNDFLVRPMELANPQMTLLQAPPAFGELLKSTCLPAPTAQAQKIDHRYGEANYYETTAGFFLLPQGGVVIRDGFGSELKMVGGSATLSCPGDVWLQPGRNLNVLAGDDVNVRAKNSMDFYTTDKDIRFKSENNMEFLSANSGNGRMLFESKADGTFQTDEDVVGEEIIGSGFIFKSEKAEFITAVAGIYLRTGGGTDDTKIQGGPIVLDADKGKKDIQVIGQTVTMHIEKALRHTFPVEGEKTVSNVFHPKGVLLHSSAIIDGNLYVMEGGITLGKGHIAMLDGQIGSGSAKPEARHVGQYRDNSLTKLRDNIELAKKNLATTIKNGTAIYEDNVKSIYYDEESQVGNGTFQARSCFSPRNDEQMNTTSFKFAENYWQQIAEATDAVPGRWSENIITYRGKDYMPYPGLKAWVGEEGSEDDKSWLTYTTTLHDSANGVDKARGSVYEDFTALGELVKVAPDNIYPITSN